jgi:hypothetical protein
MDDDIEITDSDSCRREISETAKVRNEELLHHEMITVSAMIHWMANERKVSSELVQAILETQFGVNNIQKLKRKHFDDIIKFLIDIRIKEVLH